MNDTPRLLLNAENTRALIATYRKSVQAGKTKDDDEFQFMGATLIMSYAEYLIEYAVHRSGIKPPVFARELKTERAKVASC